MDTQISEGTDNYLRMALLCLYLTRVKAVSLPPEGAVMSSLESLLLPGPWASNPGPLFWLLLPSQPRDFWLRTKLSLSDCIALSNGPLGQDLKWL